MKYLQIVTFFFFSSVLLLAQEKIEIYIDSKIPETIVSPDMYGVFFEDINFGADGGLYAEKIKNRSFDFPNSPLMGWLAYGIAEIRTEGAPFPRNPNYLHLMNKGLLTGTGVINEGYRGIGIENGKSYNFSLYGRTSEEDGIKLNIEIISDNATILSKGEIFVNSPAWVKYKIQLIPKETCKNSKLRIHVVSKGGVDIEHVSLFPEDTWKMRENGLRADIAQALADLNPGVFRFPGGCIIEGNNLETRYQWKNSVGPVENRPVNENRWNYEFQHRFTPDYFQSYGLGFFEFFQFCEDIGASPLPVVSCGFACQFATKEKVDFDDLAPYIQDALDLIDFANGPETTEWGKIRAEMGHAKPFGMKYIGVGNEQWGEDFPKYLAAFQEAIKKKYPEIILVGSSGPSPDGKDFDYLWGQMKKLNVDLVDEHYYRSPEWFLANASRYDNYDRKGPKVFAGEYACHVSDKKNSFYSALCEAAFLTGIERNADVVRLATYAPLLAHVDAWQWKPDLIWFDNLSVVKSANYYVQQLYSQYKGTNVQQVMIKGQNASGQNGIYASAVTDKVKKQLIIKIVNADKKAKSMAFNIRMKQADTIITGKKLVLKSGLNDENTLDKSDLIKPRESMVILTPSKMSVPIEPESFNIFVFEL